MSDFTHAVTVKAVRKARHCYWCREAIEAGTAAVRVTGRWDGRFDMLYVHPECEEAWQRDPCSQDNDVCPYAHARGKTCTEAESAPLVLQRR